MKRFFNIFLSIIFILIILSLTAFSVFALISSGESKTLSISDYSFYIANNVAEDSALTPGSLIVAKKSNVADISNGDYLLFANGDSVSVRYVVDFLTGGETSFVLSAGESTDDIVVPTQMIYGKIVYTSAFLGGAASFASSTIGMIVIGFSALIIILLLVLFGTKKGSKANADDRVSGALDKLANEKKDDSKPAEETEDMKEDNEDRPINSFDGTIVISKKDLESAPSDMIANILDKGTRAADSEEAKTEEEKPKEADIEKDAKADKAEAGKIKDTVTPKETAPKIEIGNLSAEDILKDLDGLL